MKWVGLLFFSGFFALPSLGATYSLNGVHPPAPLGRVIHKGVIVGGQAGRPSAVLAMRVTPLTGGGEQLTIQFADQEGHPLASIPRYFQLHLDPLLRRLVLDLSQVSKTALDRAQVRHVLLGSRYLSLGDMTMDPIDQSTNLTLHLKNSMRVKAEVGVGTLRITLLEGGRTE